jgi:hypothetical protein
MIKVISLLTLLFIISTSKCHTKMKTTIQKSNKPAIRKTTHNQKLSNYSLYLVENLLFLTARSSFSPVKDAD